MELRLPKKNEIWEYGKEARPNLWRVVKQDAYIKDARIYMYMEFIGGRAVDNPWSDRPYGIAETAFSNHWTLQSLSHYCGRCGNLALDDDYLCSECRNKLQLIFAAPSKLP